MITPSNAAMCTALQEELRVLRAMNNSKTAELARLHTNMRKLQNQIRELQDDPANS